MKNGIVTRLKTYFLIYLRQNHILHMFKLLIIWKKIITHSSGRCGDGRDVNCTPKVRHKTFGVQFTLV